MNTASDAATGKESVDASDLDLLAESIERVLMEECGSLALHAFIDGRNQLDVELWARAAGLGWLAIALPEQHGGLGFGAPGLVVLFEKLGAFAAVGPFLPTLAAAQTLADYAHDALCSEWLPKVAAGDCRIAIPASIGQGPFADPGLLLGDPDSDLALVPFGQGRMALLSFAAAGAERLDMWDRTRSVIRADLREASPLVVFNDGVAVAASLARYTSLALAAESLGGSRALLAQTIDYMKQRQQFDRPIASFQALKHRVADMMTMVVAGEPALEQALDAIADGEDADLWVALAKSKLVEDFCFIAQDCTQLHGGVGFTWEFDVHLFLKRARLNDMLVAPGWTMRDRAAAVMASAVSQGRSVLELPLI
jgi:alkylation response protein AidB-like acyl-CoA dehydrogenase